MKRLFFSLIALLCVYALPGCESPYEAVAAAPESAPLLTSPPALTVVCGAVSAEALTGSYSWQYFNEDGTSTGICADSIHPLECRDLMPVLDAGACSAELSFPQAPDSISVSCWSEVHWSEPSANSEAVTADGFQIQLKPGGYIYLVTAQWSSQETYSGTAWYSFYAEAPGEPA